MHLWLQQGPVYCWWLRHLLFPRWRVPAPATVADDGLTRF
jgi:hypothetical protein